MEKETIEFIDADHRVMDQYHELLQEDLEEKVLIKKLKAIIKKDPTFFDSYSYLSQILEGQGKLQESLILLNKGYDKCLNLILDEDKNWPDRMEWGWFENRHILRLLLNKGLSEWKIGNKVSALDILRKQLELNPNDNVGVRQFILAIRMGLTLSQFEKKFDKGGYYDSELMDWFDSNFKKFPAEFSGWISHFEENERNI